MLYCVKRDYLFVWCCLTSLMDVAWDQILQREVVLPPPPPQKLTSSVPWLVPRLKELYTETTRTVETKLPRNDHWKVLNKFYVFYADRISKMATTAGHRLALDPMGKCSNVFFSETTNMIKAKLYMNVH